MVRKVSVVVLIVSLLAVAGAVSAITYGQPDGELHRGVGAFIYKSPDSIPRVVCTGALISPTVFLTAAHCDIRAFFGPDYSVYVSFDTDLSLGARLAGQYTLHAGTLYTDPRYSQRQNDPHDIAVIVLDEPVEDRPYYQLPTLGQFDRLKLGAQFTAVGYGLQEPVQVPGSGVVNTFTGLREYSVSSLNAVNKAWLRLSQNAATNDGGTCNGDSGGPNFFGAGGGETPVIAATTITGDVFCRATNVVYRLDTAAAREFLDAFVSLP